MKESITTDDAQDDGRVIEVNKCGVAEIREKEGRQMPSGPDLPYDVTESHSTKGEPAADTATASAEHQVAMREAKKRAGLVSEDAYYNITSPVRPAPE
ncbi:hypothetical protein [Aliihoeflea sp. 40Bstr573]|uniref:hypothetical protein n=1 Tax=Aliihoeflea sp. 40Bstr573 TaxID=2696467 RepID=UPI00209569F4|nr:hypothetical protein [Aliihoeflea sp. 40Bstr573]MCO6389345.1 hypothetical protein [Aliihoeflea sp. 40Bstr573]